MKDKIMKYGFMLDMWMGAWDLAMKRWFLRSET